MLDKEIGVSFPHRLSQEVSANVIVPQLSREISLMERAAAQPWIRDQTSVPWLVSNDSSMLNI
jgi:hypothetical protein